MNLLRTTAACVAFAVLAGVAAAAADEDVDEGDGKPAELERLVVIATRAPDDVLLVPAAVDVIAGEEIGLAQPRIDLAESLDRVPGVVARDRHNQAQDLQISIRGFGARSTFGVRGVRLYTDGIPATMPDGQGQVSHFPLQSAARIEVLRGPYSALYGNASGGVIELVTADAPAAPLLRAGHVTGADGLARSSLSFHAPWPVHRDGSLLLDLVNVDTQGYRDHSAATRRTGHAMLKGRFDAGGRYTLLGNWLDLDALDPQGLTLAQLEGDHRAASTGALAFDTRKTVRQHQLGARLERELTSDYALELMVYSGNRKTTQMLSIPVFVQEDPLQGGGAIDLDRNYYGADLRLHWSSLFLGRPFSLVSGFNHEVSDERRRGYENFIGADLGVAGALRRDEDNRVTGNAVYLQADWEPSARWRVNAGVRHSEVRFESRDHYITGENPDDSGRLQFARTTPVAGVLFRATPGISIYANAGTGFETPTFSELAYRRDGRSGLNDDLHPAVSRSVEAGMRARHGTLRYAAAIFHSRTRDELAVAANEGGRSVYANAGVARRRGVELSVSGELAANWRYAASYTFLDTRYRRGFAGGLDGRAIPGLARHVAWSEMVWSPSAHTDIVLEGQFVDRVPVNDENTEAAPSYARFDLGAERHFHVAGLDWRAFVRVRNILDRDYIGSVIVNEGNGRYYEPAPGRTWLLGVALAY